MKNRYLLLLLLIGLMTTSSFAQKKKNKKDPNPAAEGFNLAGSDARAVELADEVMTAMGGRRAWDNTHYLTWNFFGSRRLVWDKWSGNVRVENLRNGTTTLVNINTRQGKFMRNGAEETQPDSVKKYSDRGVSAWINDSYWLVMPYKLKDSGVTLKYIGEEKTEAGEEAEVIQMTFQNVGDTPQNKYKIWISKASHLVVQWAHFSKAENEKPNFVNPWLEYEKHGNVLLSGSRGQRKITEIKVFDSLPETIFTSFDKVDLSQIPESPIK